MIATPKKVQMNEDIKNKLGTLHRLFKIPIRSKFQTSIKELTLFETIANKRERNIPPCKKLNAKIIPITSSNPCSVKMITESKTMHRNSRMKIKLIIRHFTFTCCFFSKQCFGIE